MRQLFLILVLIGAAFLGGAFVNGPGMQWVQTQVMGSLGLDDDGEIATVDLKADEPKESGKTPESRSASSSRSSKTESAPASTVSPLAPIVPPELLSASDDAPKKGKTTSHDGPQRDPNITRAAASAAPTSTTSHPDEPSPPDAMTTLIPSPASPSPSTSPSNLIPMPMPAPSPLPSPSPSPLPKPGQAGDDNDWSALARKMRAMGISRYTIEGQPGGRVVFSCLIPMAGRHAVAQRFEAEGEDAIRAARAALRRIALWRAAQPQPTSPSQPTSR